MRGNRSLVLASVGAGLLLISSLFSWIRVNASANPVGDPSSVNGISLTQGKVVVVLALALVAVAALVERGLIKLTITAVWAFALGTTAFFVLLAIITNGKDITMALPAVWGVAILIATAVTATTQRFYPGGMSRILRRLIKLGVFLAAAVLVGVLVTTPLFHQEAQPLWLVFLFTVLPAGAIAILQKPHQLAPNRLLAVAGFGTMFMTFASAAAIRHTMVELQTANGEPNLIRLIQVGNGLFLAWIGGLVLFSGLTGLWAQRRDTLATLARIKPNLLDEAQVAADIEIEAVLQAGVSAEIE